jgi:hypothetical protein
MMSQSIDVSRSLPSGPLIVDTPDTWGTPSRFRRLARVDLDDAAYWLAAVSRPAHRAGHPRLNVKRCPGCVFETATAA